MEMEYAVYRAFTALGILTATLIAVTFVAVCAKVIWDAWKTCRDLAAGKRLVLHSFHESTDDCITDPRDPACPVHGEPDPPRDLVEGTEAKDACICSPRPGRGGGHGLLCPEYVP